MEKSLIFILQIFFIFSTQAQTVEIGPLYNTPSFLLKNPDSLQKVLLHTKNDTAKINLLIILAQAYNQQQKNDSSIWFAQQALVLAQKAKFLRGIYGAQFRLAHLFSFSGNYPKAIQLALANMQLAERYKDTIRIFYLNRQLSLIYSEINDYTKALEYARKNKRLVHSGYFRNKSELNFYSLIGYINIMADAFSRLNQLDSALYYSYLSYKFNSSLKNTEGLAIATGNLGNTLLKSGKYAEALFYYRKSIRYAAASNRKDVIAESYLGLAKLFQKKEPMDSALFYGKKSLSIYQHLKLPARELLAASLLDELYVKKNQLDSAYKYLAMAVVLQDSLFNLEKIKQVQNIQFNEKLRLQQVEQARKEVEQQYETRIKIYSLAGGLAILFFIAFILYRNNQNKQKANELLSRKNLEIDQQRTKAEKALEELKATQVQLIQSEKMASLGDLTAGIAHEIQNPLNFVNNFSEVSKELCQELKEELTAEHPAEANAIAEDLSQNLDKIHHHGQRADAIVKSMLQHARTTSGEKQLTDINALTEEYLRLSYQGLRAKDKDFSANLITDFDNSLKQVEVVPQELGRVLLNLYNNAFYATHQKKVQLNGQYQPEVKVSTRCMDNQVEIKVHDNGIGIPPNIQQRIFQPFFTTKPTGQGTGLGLSLSYDIITKGHGGEIKVESQEGEYSEFIVKLNL